MTEQTWFREYSTFVISSVLSLKLNPDERLHALSISASRGYHF
jgi:hypothetical protein